MTAPAQSHPKNLDDVATPARAWALILPSWFLFALLDASAKYVVIAGMAPLFVAWCRFAGHTVFIVIAMRSWRNLELLKTNHPYQQILRGGMLVSGTYMNFLALQHLQLAQTMAIALAVPMLVTALAGPMLGEWAGWRRWMAVIVGFIGVLVIVRPGTDMFEWPILYSLGTLVAASLYFIMTRKMTSTETDESMIVFGGLIPTLLLSPAMVFHVSLPPGPVVLAALIATGIFGALGHLFLIKAHRLAAAPLLAPAVFSQILWSVLLGYLIFSQLPDKWTLLGIAIIAASGFYIFNRERRLMNS